MVTYERWEEMLQGEEHFRKLQKMYVRMLETHTPVASHRPVLVYSTPARQAGVHSDHFPVQ